MTLFRFHTVILIVVTVVSGGCATTLYDTLLEGADRIIPIHTAKDKPRTPDSSSAESVRMTSSMNEITAAAATNSTTYVDEKAYRARTAGLDVRSWYATARCAHSIQVHRPNVQPGFRAPKPLAVSKQARFVAFIAVRIERIRPTVATEVA